MSRLWRATACAVWAAYLAAGQAPPNDGVATALPLAAGINPSPPAGAHGVLFSNEGADDTPGFSTGYVDVFFSYAATASGPGAFSVCPAPGYPTPSATGLFVEVYAATGGPPLASNAGACPSGAATSLTLSAGATYVVRVGCASASGAGNFRLTVAPPAACGDAPAAAFDLGSGDAFAFAYEAPAGATADPTQTLCGNLFLAWSFPFFTGPPLVDAWATFTPTVTGRIFHTNPAAPPGVGTGTQAWPDLRWGFAPVGGGGAAGCMNSNSTVASAPLVVAGTTYLLRVASVGAPAPRCAASFRIVPLPGDCAAPAAAPLGSTVIDLLAAPLDPSCAASNARVAWFSFTAPSTGVVDASALAAISPASDPAPGLADGWTGPPSPLAVTVYGGPCGALVRLIGAVVGSARFPVVAGVEYRLRVTSVLCMNLPWSATTPAGGTLTLSYVAAVPGDDCAAPLPFVNGVSIGTPAGATFDGTPFGACGPADQPTLVDLWHEFVAAETGAHFLSAGGGAAEIFANGCGGAPIACTSGAPTSFAAVAGTTYLIRVASNVAFSLPIGAPPAAPPYQLTVVLAAPNDECAGAEPLSPGDNPATGWFDTGVATPSPAQYSCYDPGSGPPSFYPGATWPRVDLFFSYVPDFTDVAAVQAVGPPANYVRPWLFVYDAATCAAGGAPLVCGDEGRAEFAAAAGSSYVVRVASFVGSAGPFRLRVGRALRTLSAPSSGVPDEGLLGVGADPLPWIGGGGSWFDYGLLLVLGAPAAAPIALDVAAPGVFPPGTLLHVEPAGAILFGPLPINESFYYVLSPYSDPATWGTVFAVQAFFAGYDSFGGPRLRPSNGVIAVTGV